METKKTDLMEETILKILKNNILPDEWDTSEANTAKEITDNFKAFLKWLHNPKCDFATCYNGTDKTRDKICYERNAKHYTIDEVYRYWQEHK